MWNDQKEKIHSTVVKSQNMLSSLKIEEEIKMKIQTK